MPSDPLFRLIYFCVGALILLAVIYAIVEIARGI